MAKRKYKAVRMPLEAYNNFLNKKSKMENTIKKIIRKPITIPLTKIFIATSENPITIDDEYIIKLIKKNKKNEKTIF